MRLGACVAHNAYGRDSRLKTTIYHKEIIDLQAARGLTRCLEASANERNPTRVNKLLWREIPIGGKEPRAMKPPNRLGKGLQELKILPRGAFASPEINMNQMHSAPCKSTQPCELGAVLQALAPAKQWRFSMPKM